MLTPKPWEKRLRDLHHSLSCCASSYFDPELFRRNTNNFLQTSRTVTFIIQKNKSDIVDFDSWYQENVLEKWKDDEVMRWAKDSRNQIEKQGDLEFNSTLGAKFISSYLEEEDIEIECGREELLGFGIKKLVRHARKHLAADVFESSVIKIERIWITTSLLNWELLNALSYIYYKIYECCLHLGQYLNSPLDKKHVA